MIRIDIYLYQRVVEGTFDRTMLTVISSIVKLVDTFGLEITFTYSTDQTFCCRSCPVKSARCFISRAGGLPPAV